MPACGGFRPVRASFPPRLVCDAPGPLCYLLCWARGVPEAGQAAPLPAPPHRPPGDSDQEQTHIHCRLPPPGRLAQRRALMIPSPRKAGPLFIVRDPGATDLDQEKSEVQSSPFSSIRGELHSTLGNDNPVQRMVNGVAEGQLSHLGVQPYSHLLGLPTQHLSGETPGSRHRRRQQGAAVELWA